MMDFSFKGEVKLYRFMKSHECYIQAIEQLDLINKKFKVDEGIMLYEKADCYFKAENYIEAHRVAKKAYRLLFDDQSRKLMKLSREKIGIKLL